MKIASDLARNINLKELSIEMHKGTVLKRTNWHFCHVSDTSTRVL